MADKTGDIEQGLFAGGAKRVVRIAVRGPGNFALGPLLKQFAALAIEEGCRRLVLDLRECSAVDSTFLGVMAGLAGRMNRQGGSRMDVIRVSEKLRDTLSTLGLDRLMALHSSAPDDLAFLPEGTDGLQPLRPKPPPGRGETRRTMIEAHESLSELSEANARRFKDVLEFLRRDDASGAAGEGEA